MSKVSLAITSLAQVAAIGELSVAKVELSHGDVVSIMLDVTLTLLHMEDGIRLLSDQLPPLRQTDELRKSTAAIRDDMNRLVEKITKLAQEDT